MKGLVFCLPLMIGGGVIRQGVFVQKKFKNTLEISMQLFKGNREGYKKVMKTRAGAI